MTGTENETGSAPYSPDGPRVARHVLAAFEQVPGAMTTGHPSRHAEQLAVQAAPLLSREVLRLTDLLAAVEALVTDPKRAVSPYRCPLDLRTFAPGTRDFGPQWVAWDRGRDDGADYLATRVRMAMEGNPYA